MTNCFQTGPNRTSDDILRVSGIESRRWVDRSKNETVLSLAVLASKNLLERQKLSIHDIDLVIACTTTPDLVTPSLACRIAASLAKDGMRPAVAAYDVNAACSGYIYALAQAFDYLQQRPQSRVLVVTSEVLSPMLEMKDFDTAILFGDAATATLLAGTEHGTPWLQLHRPLVSGNPDIDSIVCVPLFGQGTISISGGRVFKQAVQSMVQSLNQACRLAKVSLQDLDAIVPHQANQRILDAIASRTTRPVLSQILKCGNTSSSSIPLALAVERLNDVAHRTYGFVTFGGGLTHGACIAVRHDLHRDICTHS